MLQSIFDLIENLVKSIKIGIDFVIDLVVGMADLGSYVQAIAAELPAYYSWFPPACVTVFSAAFLIVVFYKFFGRT